MFDIPKSDHLEIWMTKIKYEGVRAWGAFRIPTKSRKGERGEFSKIAARYIINEIKNNLHLRSLALYADFNQPADQLSTKK